MKPIGTFCQIACLCLCLVIFLGSLSQVQSQDLFRDADQIKRDLSSLRNEVSELRKSLEALRKMVLKGATSQDVGQTETMPGGGETGGESRARCGRKRDHTPRMPICRQILRAS